jgi:hypothetical protein
VYIAEQELDLARRGFEKVRAEKGKPHRRYKKAEAKFVKATAAVENARQAMDAAQKARTKRKRGKRSSKGVKETQAHTDIRLVCYSTILYVI